MYSPSCWPFLGPGSSFGRHRGSRRCLQVSRRFPSARARRGGALCVTTNSILSRHKRRYSGVTKRRPVSSRPPADTAWIAWIAGIVWNPPGGFHTSGSTSSRSSASIEIAFPVRLSLLESPRGRAVRLSVTFLAPRTGSNPTVRWISTPPAPIVRVSRVSGRVRSGELNQADGTAGSSHCCPFW